MMRASTGNLLLPTTMSNSNSSNGLVSSGNSGPNEDSASSAAGNSNNSSSAATAAGNAASFKMLLLIMMVLQNSATVLVGRYTRTRVAKDELYDVNHLIVVIEFGKLFLSCLFEFYHTNGKFVNSIRVYILDHPIDTLKILIPALLYLVQNTLLYVALSNLTAPIFQVTYQAKLVTTAIVSVFLLRRSYSVQQWICLVLLSLGVAIVVLGEQQKSTSSSSSRHLLEDSSSPAPQQNLLVGLTAVTIACFSSALAGVYFEMVLKVPSNSDATKHPPASLWMRNIQLSMFSIVIALVQGMMKGTSSATTQSYLFGFNVWVWILVILQAGGGLLVAAVIKYADNVLKGLATGVSVVFATVLSTMLFSTPLSNQFTFGATMILGAVYYFSNPLPATVSNLFASFSGSNGKDKSDRLDNIETKNLLPK